MTCIFPLLLAVPTPAPRSVGRAAEVRTVGYWNAKHDQGWGLDWHRNEGIELTTSTVEGDFRG